MAARVGVLGVKHVAARHVDDDAGIARIRRRARLRDGKRRHVHLDAARLAGGKDEEREQREERAERQAVTLGGGVARRRVTAAGEDSTGRREKRAARGF